MRLLRPIYIDRYSCETGTLWAYMSLFFKGVYFIVTSVSIVRLNKMNIGQMSQYFCHADPGFFLKYFQRINRSALSSALQFFAIQALPIQWSLPLQSSVTQQTQHPFGVVPVGRDR